MLNPRQKLSANDNVPVSQSPIRNSFVRPNPSPVRAKEQSISSGKALSSLAWLIPIGAIFAGAMAIRHSSPLTSLYWPSLSIGIALLFTTIMARPNSRLRNFSSLLMVLSLTTALAAVLAQNGFKLVGLEVLLVLSTLGIITGWIFSSRPSALLSVFAVLLYQTSYFPELGLLTGISEEASQLGAELVPWLVLSQIGLGHKVKSSTVLMVAIAAGYIWLTTLADNMPLAEMAGLGFAIAAAHYWLGKSRVEKNVFGAEIHRICAWFVAIGSALYVQSIWLNMDVGQAKTHWPTNLKWWVILGIAMFSLFLVSLQRYKTSHISLFGIFVICAAVLILPAATARPDLIYSSFDTIPGLNAHPGLGFVMGATLIAAGFYWLIGGLKSGRIIDMIIGALAIGVETIILFQPEKFNVDLGVIFVVSLICALCIGGLVAGVSTDRSQAVDNYL